MTTIARHNSRQRSAFTLVEILIVVIILGILAALVVPKFSSAQSVAKASSLRNDLRYFRTQVMVYRAQHGVSPGHPNGNPAIAPNYETLVAQLTQFTNEHGDISPAANNGFRYGPYMQDIPVNPLNGSNAVRFIEANQMLPTAPEGDEGWIYQPATATVIANSPGKDESGIAYFDY